MRRVALIIETSISYGRGLLAGISRYNRLHGGWLIDFHPRGFGDPLPSWLNRDWKGDGILGGIGWTVPGDLLASFGVPVINLRARVDPRFPTVCTNNARVGELAANHLLERGLKSFGFCGKGAAAHTWFDQRCAAFKARVESAGGSFHRFALPAEVARQNLTSDQFGLEDWVRSLPKPVGVLASNDIRGVQILEACRRCGAQVPDEVAVIGADNDEALCELAIPPLSSIDVNAPQIGFEAAKLLDALMDGQPAPTEPLTVEPREVVTRRSTDVLASEDDAVNRAVRFIREHACEHGLRVEDVQAQVHLSRQALQERMKRVLGRTVHQEILRVRINAARQLLTLSEVPIKEVAYRTGFASVQHLTNAFGRAVGQSPARFRGLHLRPT